MGAVKDDTCANEVAQMKDKLRLKPETEARDLKLELRFDT